MTTYTYIYRFHVILNKPRECNLIANQYGGEDVIVAITHCVDRRVNEDVIVCAMQARFSSSYVTFNKGSTEEAWSSMPDLSIFYLACYVLRYFLTKSPFIKITLYIP